LEKRELQNVARCLSPQFFRAILAVSSLLKTRRDKLRESDNGRNFSASQILTGCRMGSEPERKREEGTKMKKIMGLVLGILLLSGCGGYWMVTDPSTKNVYYTEEVQQSKSSGSVKFIDAKTKNSVNLQNSEVKEITKDEFKTAVGKK
jgi:hypothetical protein